MPPNTVLTSEPKDRRKFLLQLSWGGLAFSAAVFMTTILRFVWPSVSSRPPRSFQVGFPDDYRVGQVAYHPGREVFILRDERGFLSLSARCTHLGCLVVWNRDHKMFLCPCHGGKFDAAGRNVEGPPPRPLDLFDLRIDKNGFLVVDQDIIIKRPKGPVPRFQPEKA